MRPRWDVDGRGHGVASAEQAVPDLDRLREAMPTHVVERSPDVGRDVELFVTTGMLEGDGHFAPHGHTVRFRVSRG